MNIELEKLRVSRFNVRRDIGDISELVESVRAQGMRECKYLAIVVGVFRRYK